MKEIKTLELKGYVQTTGWDEEGLVLGKEVKSNYRDRFGVGQKVMEHFMKLSKPVDVSFGDWATGEYMSYKDVFCEYIVVDTEMGWDDANKLHLKSLAGDLEAMEKYCGYSEYTITHSWTDLFVGGHDLNEELKNKEGKYVIIRIHYKV